MHVEAFIYQNFKFEEKALIRLYKNMGRVLNEVGIL